jgi:hypothetical protein
MADAGADPFTLAAILGHSDIRMTARYTHAMDEAKRRAVDKLVVARALGAVEHGALPNGRATAPALGAGEAPAVPVRAVEKLVAPRLVETRPLPQAVLTKALGAGGKEALPNGRATAPALGAGETPAVPVRAVEKLVAPGSLETRPLPQAVLTKALGAGGMEALPKGRATAPALGAGEPPAVPVKKLPVAIQVKGTRTRKVGNVLATETKTASSASPIRNPRKLTVCVTQNWWTWGGSV